MPYGSKLHIPPTSYHLIAGQQEPYKNNNKKPVPWQKHAGEVSTKSKENGSLAEKMTGQKEQEDWAEKNERGDRKREPNDSPEIPDWGTGASDTPGLPSR